MASVWKGYILVFHHMRNEREQMQFYIEQVASLYVTFSSDVARFQTEKIPLPIWLHFYSSHNHMCSNWCDHMLCRYVCDIIGPCV